MNTDADEAEKVILPLILLKKYDVFWRFYFMERKWVI
jgi:hypothetical protein